MFVVPYFYEKPLPSIIGWQLQPITIFLENHGKHLYSTENPQQWLVENGFFSKKSWKENEILFVEVDTDKTKLKDFYSYEELTKEQRKGTEECWRTFFFMKTINPDEKDSEISWNQYFDGPIQKVLTSIQARV
jgi:hypothetical protein